MSKNFCLFICFKIGLFLISNSLLHFLRYCKHCWLAIRFSCSFLLLTFSVLVGWYNFCVYKLYARCIRSVFIVVMISLKWYERFIWEKQGKWLNWEYTNRISPPTVFDRKYNENYRDWTKRKLQLNRHTQKKTKNVSRKTCMICFWKRLNSQISISGFATWIYTQVYQT